MEQFLDLRLSRHKSLIKTKRSSSSNQCC